MSQQMFISDKFWPLLNAACDGTLLATQIQELEAVLDSDVAVRKVFADHFKLKTDIRFLGRAERIRNLGLAGVRATFSQALPSPSDSPAPTSLSTTLPNTLGFLSSGWPVAYLIATVIFGIGALIGANTYLTRPVQVAEQLPSVAKDRLVPRPRMELVGRITGMVDCKWTDPSTETILGSYVPLGRKYSLSSGLMEITYDTGARAILQGPVTYEVLSKHGGFLPVGKLTGKVEGEAAKGFCIRTPTGVVTDLGTEFGVEVSKEGRTISHVFRGSVRVQLVEADAENQDNTIVLHENESAQIQHVADATRSSVRLCRINLNPQVFVRRLPQPMRTLDLSDIVAGGDGRAQHRRRNPNAINSMDRMMLVPEAGNASWAPRFGTSDELIDRVFSPDTSQGKVLLDTDGHSFAGFPKLGNNLHASIWASAADSGKSAHNCRRLLGLCPNAGITFDLKAMRQKYSGARLDRFRSVVFCGSSAGNTTLFQDDFQSYTAGTMPRDAGLVLMPILGARDTGGFWMRTWDDAGGTGIQVWNNVNPAKPTNDSGTNNYLKMQSNAGPLLASGWADDATRHNQVELSFSIWKDSTKPTFSAVTGFIDHTDNGRSFSVYFLSNGAVSYYDGDNLVDAGITYQTDSWQEVMIRADMATQTFSLTVGTATADKLHWKHGANMVNRICFGNNSEYPGQFFIDNVKLSAVAGFSKSQRLGFGKNGQGDFWVFVDGRLKLNRTKLRPQDGVVPVNIDISPDDRFLTLVATDGEISSTLWSWMIFGDPVLEMTSSESTGP